MQCDPLMCSTDDAENLPAVVAGVVVAFLLLTLLIAGIIVGVVVLRRRAYKRGMPSQRNVRHKPIAGIIVGVVMLGRAKRRKNSPEKKGKLVEKVECAEKQEELSESEPTADNNNEWQTDEAAFHYEQHVEGLHYSHCGHYDDNVAALLRDGDGDAHRKGNTQQDDQPKGTPNVVYAVVDKSKKMRQEETQGGASATTTQGVNTEEQHYESSSAFGQDWFGNVVGGKPEDNHVEQGSRSNDANGKGTGPQSEPCNPNAVSACRGGQEQEKEQSKTE